jgi:hypothetical protein
MRDYAGDNADGLDIDRRGCRGATWVGLRIGSKQEVTVGDEERECPKHRHSPEFYWADEMKSVPQLLHHHPYSYHYPS